MSVTESVSQNFRRLGYWYAEYNDSRATVDNCLFDKEIYRVYMYGLCSINTAQKTFMVQANEPNEESLCGDLATKLLGRVDNIQLTCQALVDMEGHGVWPSC